MVDETVFIPNRHNLGEGQPSDQTHLIFHVRLFNGAVFTTPTAVHPNLAETLEALKQGDMGWSVPR